MVHGCTVGGVCVVLGGISPCIRAKTYVNEWIPFSDAIRLRR